MPLRSEIPLNTRFADTTVSWVHYEIAWDSLFTRPFLSDTLNLGFCETGYPCPLRLRLEPGSDFYLRTFNFLNIKRDPFESPELRTGRSKAIRLRTASLSVDPTRLEDVLAAGDTLRCTVELPRGADRVHIQVSEDSLFANIAKDWVDTSYFPEEQVIGAMGSRPGGPLRIRTWANVTPGRRYFVRAHAQWGKYPAPWSRVIPIDLPVALSPLLPAANSVVTAPSVVLAWRPVAKATGYAVTAKVPGNQEGWTLFEDRVTSDTFLVLRDPPRGRTVQWYFRAALDQEWTPPSDTNRAFRVSKLPSQSRDTIIPLVEGYRWKYANTSYDSSYVTNPMTWSYWHETSTLELTIEDAVMDDGYATYLILRRKTDTTADGTVFTEDHRTWILQDYGVNPPRLLKGSPGKWGYMPPTDPEAVFNVGLAWGAPESWYSYHGRIDHLASWSWVKLFMGMGVLSLHSSYSSGGSSAGRAGSRDLTLLEFNGEPFIESQLIPANPPPVAAHPVKYRENRPRSAPGWASVLNKESEWSAAELYSLKGDLVAIVRNHAEAAALRPGRGLYLLRVRTPKGIRILKAMIP